MTWHTFATVYWPWIVRYNIDIIVYVLIIFGTTWANVRRKRREPRGWRRIETDRPKGER